MWKWDTCDSAIEHGKDIECSGVGREIIETPDTDEGEPDEDTLLEEPCETNTPHTVIFKCIGAVRDESSQATLCAARDRLSKGYTVPVRITPEPTNIYDSKAIAFVCEIDLKWKRVGYVVKEILNEVHSVLNENKVLSVKFEWIKYVTNWTRSGPGYFAGISVTKSGQWPSNVVKHRSTR